MCTNTEGSFECSCFSGYIPRTDFLNLCEGMNYLAQIVVVIIVSFVCVCVCGGGGGGEAKDVFA